MATKQIGRKAKVFLDTGVLVSELKASKLNKDIISAFLYGSFAKGEPSEKSDIDLALFVEDKLTKEKKALLFETKNNLEGKTHRDVHLQLLSYAEAAKGKNAFLVRDIISHGRLLYANKPLALGEKFFGLKEYDLFVYDFTNISKSKAVTLSRKLNGFTQKKAVKGEVKEYRNKGIIKMIGGKKLGDGVMLIPKASSPLIVRLFEEFNVTPKVTTVFLIEEI